MNGAGHVAALIFFAEKGGCVFAHFVEAAQAHDGLCARDHFGAEGEALADASHKLGGQIKAGVFADAGGEVIAVAAVFVF